MDQLAPRRRVGYRDGKEYVVRGVLALWCWRWPAPKTASRAGTRAALARACRERTRRRARRAEPLAKTPESMDCRGDGLVVTHARQKYRGVTKRKNINIAYSFQKIQMEETDAFTKNEGGKRRSPARVYETELPRVAPHFFHALAPANANPNPTSTMPPKKTPTKKAAPKATKKITKKPAKSPKKAKVAKADKPKREPGPYMKFCKAERPKIVAANPNFSFGEVGKELGAKWRGMSDAQKAKYK